MFRWLFESPYFDIRQLRACFAVSYDISRRNRNRISLSFMSMTSSRLRPLIVPSSFTSATIRRTLCVNFPIIPPLEPPVKVPEHAWVRWWIDWMMCYYLASSITLKFLVARNSAQKHVLAVSLPHTLSKLLRIHFFMPRKIIQTKTHISWMKLFGAGAMFVMKVTEEEGKGRPNRCLLCNLVHHLIKEICGLSRVFGEAEKNFAFRFHRFNVGLSRKLGQLCASIIEWSCDSPLALFPALIHVDKTRNQSSSNPLDPIIPQNHNNLPHSSCLTRSFCYSSALSTFLTNQASPSSLFYPSSCQECS